RVTASRPGAGRNGAPSCAQSSCFLRHVAHWFAPFRRPEVGPIPRVDPRTAGPLALRFMRPRHVAHWFAPFRGPEVGPIPRVDPRTGGAPRPSLHAAPGTRIVRSPTYARRAVAALRWSIPAS